MRLSEERIAHISQAIMKALIRGKFIETLQPEEKLYREIKRTMVSILHEEDELDVLVRRKIQSMSRTIPEGSAEWSVLHRKYMEEEMRRRKKL